MAAASVLFGGFAAVGRVDLDGVLAYSSIAQVGFVVLPLGVAATAPSPAIRALGVTAALVYAFNHGIAKGLLFLVSGTIEDALGTTDMSEVSGLAARSPVLAGAFLVGALALVGVPPLSGFFGKFLVFDAGARAYAAGAAGAGAVLAVALAGAVLTIAYYTRAWNAVFWGDATELVDAVLPTGGADVGDTPVGGAVADGAGSGPGPRSDSGPDSDREAESDADARTDGDTGADAEAGSGRAPDRASDGSADAGGRRPHGGGHPGPTSRQVALAGEVTVVASLAIAVVAFGIGFEAVVAAAEAAAEAALDTGSYVEAVGPAEALESAGASEGGSEEVVGR
jgi:multicomponent Na+:H+ antiporter subunit D